MKKIFVMVKESLQYNGIIVIALLSGLFLQLIYHPSRFTGKNRVNY